MGNCCYQGDDNNAMDEDKRSKFVDDLEEEFKELHNVFGDNSRMFNRLAIILQHHVFPKMDDSSERRRFISTLFSLIYTVQIIKSYIR